MNENMGLWMETAFNVAYLTVIWALVAMMYRQYRHMPPQSRRLQVLFMTIFALLALGDTGHVGFRVVAFASGDMGMTVNIFGKSIGLLALGTLSTSITVTFFYMLLIFIWQVRFNQKLDAFAWFLLAAGVIRLVIMACPLNEWNVAVPSHTWSLIRNLPLIIQGLGVAYLILRDSSVNKDKIFKQVAVWILVSFAFFIPVILFVRQIPLIGLLMIPKTLTYMVIAVIGYRNLFRKGVDEQLQQASATV